MTKINGLRYDSLWAQPVYQSWDSSDLAMDAGDADDGVWSYYQAMDYEADGRTWRLIVANGLVTAVWVPEHDRHYSREQFEEYTDRIDDRTGVLLPFLIEREWEQLFEADTRSARGPMPSWWYPCPSVEDDPVHAAALIRGTCVVLVDTTWGLALTGAGQNSTWALVESYVAVGEYPPVQYARELPTQAGRGKSESDRLLVAVCRDVLTTAAGLLQNWENDLRIRAVDWGTYD